VRLLLPAMMLGGAIAAILILNFTPISTIEIPLSGGNSFIPALFGTAGVATVAAFAVGTAVWIEARVAVRNRVERELGTNGAVFMIQSTAPLKKAFAGARLPTLTTLSLSSGTITLHGARGATATIRTSDLLDVEVRPKGYQDRIPTIELTVRRGASVEVVDFVLAADGNEFFPERKLARLEELRDRIERLGGHVSPTAG